MARLVFATGVPHGPQLPQRVAEAPGQLHEEKLMGQVRVALEAAAPDVIVEFASDHFTNFFYNNLPPFCVAAVENAQGPNETYCIMPEYRFQGRPSLAKGLQKFALESEFDLALAEELRPDHSVLVPLHFIVPGRNIPVVPIYVNGLGPPIPSAKRCQAFGAMVGRFIESWPGNERIALLASGVFSLEVGGPQMGWTDEEWVGTVGGHIGAASYAELAEEATAERMAHAGNVSGELLNWVAMTGALRGQRPDWLETTGGSGYATWRFE